MEEGDVQKRPEAHQFEFDLFFIDIFVTGKEKVEYLPNDNEIPSESRPNTEANTDIVSQLEIQERKLNQMEDLEQTEEQVRLQDVNEVEEAHFFRNGFITSRDLDKESFANDECEGSFCLVFNMSS